MTDEQIKQRAEEYASHKLDWSRNRHGENPYLAWKEGFEDGAHSRDEEVEMLQNQIEELSEQLKMNAENIKKLRNPWISVKDRLPIEECDYDGNRKFVLVRIYNFTRCAEWIEMAASYSEKCKDWRIADMRWLSKIADDMDIRVTHWMSIPGLKK